MQATYNVGSEKLAQEGEIFLCFYTNYTSKIQVAKINNIKDCNFERVVFPGQRMLFEAMPNAQLEIHTSGTGKEILSDRINCDGLRVN
ncbi:DUF1830 domain-containing protein [Microcoleus sp. FACHB-831]|uniref:DUF1830 domain-containing protein n=1 Tax=Microcoleus sp. FACHB-831 TaxID=2692827 RepID=UPI001682820A|nr:DUF1830 domain-containing protein [Microcoleus sp. FACHB-831]MBD1920913.1 DUF1830 domain-containing protein [Microcoleus sp. FACHB-831]